MRTPTLLLAAVAAMSLSACLDTPTDRAFGGAAAGALIADATKNDVLTGALIGGIAGAVSCNAPGVAPCNNY